MCSRRAKPLSGDFIATQVWPPTLGVGRLTFEETRSSLATKRIFLMGKNREHFRGQRQARYTHLLEAKASHVDDASSTGPSVTNQMGQTGEATLAARLARARGARRPRNVAHLTRVGIPIRHLTQPESPKGNPTSTLGGFHVIIRVVFAPCLE